MAQSTFAGHPLHPILVCAPVALLPLPVSAATQLARPVASVVAGLVLYAALLQAFGVVRLRALLSRPKARLP